MQDWGDDAGTRGTMRLRCVEPVRGGDEDEPLGTRRGCGWTGTTRTVTQYGLTEWELSSCLECGGEIGEMD